MPLTPPVAGAADSPHRLPAAPRRPLRFVLRFAFGLIFAAASLFLTLWLTLHWGILPRIEQWRPQLETQASRALGVPVRIGGISAASHGWVPSVELREVTLLDAQGRPALQLPRVAASLSARSLLALELRFEQLLIEGPQLEIRRDSSGRVFVAGLEMSGGEGGDGALGDWFFRQTEFIIRDGSLYWTDEQRDAPTLALTQVQLAVRNGLLHHDLRLDATPDDPWGERFSLRGRFTRPLLSRPGDWQRWSGTAFVSLPRADVKELRRYVTLPFELDEGDGALRAWIDLKEGRPTAVTADVALRAVSMRLAADVEPLVVEQVQGRLSARRDEQGVSVALQDFGFLTGDGVRWPQGDLALAWKQREGEAVSGGEFSAQRLDLDVMAQIAGRLPLGEALRRLLAELAPQGVVTGLAANWSGPLDAPTKYRAKAQFTGLSLAARPSAEGGVGRPGLRNATVQVNATEAGGQAKLDIADGELDFPGVFDEPRVPFRTLGAQLAWTVTPRSAGQPPQVSVTVKDGRFANADAQGELSARWSTGAGEGFRKGGRLPGLIELDGRIVQGEATQVARYLPLHLADTRRYLGRAIRGGAVRDASFRVKGDLWDFPYHGTRDPKDGEFRIAGRVEGATFDYVPSLPAIDDKPAWASPWPAFTQVSGDLVIDRAVLEIRDARAQLAGVAISQVNGGFRNLANQPVLALDGVARGPLADMLRFVNATPVGQWTGGALSRATASGNAELKLGLSLPLAELSASTVKGSLALAGNDVRMTPDTPMMAGARARIEFTHKGVTVTGATARMLGGDASFDGSTQPDGSLRFSGQGTASAEGLRRATELGVLSRLASHFSGQAAYRASLGFVKGFPELSVTSNLAGMASDLPAPLRKAAETPLPLRYQTTLASEPSAGQAPRDTLRLEIGSIVQAQYERELADSGPRVLRGGIGINEPMPTPASGVWAHASLAALPLDAWEGVASRLFPSASAGAAGPAGASNDSGGYLPTQLALRAQTLNTSARQFNRVVIGASHDDNRWKANVEAEQFSGYVEYRSAAAGQSAGRVHARLARLSLPKGDDAQVETLLDQQAPTTVPSLDIVVEDFELRGKRLGRVEVDAVNRVVGEGREARREWRLNRLALTTPEAQLVGSGQWSEIGGTFMTVPGAASSVRRRAVLDFKLDIADAGALLERLGTGKAVRGGKGQLSGQVSWLGSPLSLDYPTLSGSVAVSVDNGQFLKAEPGAARLLGVLSLQALPRRLVLDFRDVFQEGFAFDALTGDLKIAQGVASTNNLRMRGVQAAVLMEGQADIARETQDLRVVVVPEINAGTASLAYAAINPAVGLGTFLAQMFLRRPLTEAGTREFHVSGPWSDPKVERIERKVAEPAPPLDAPAAPPRPAAQ